MAEVLPGFLSAHEITELRDRATATDGWTAGRQGTGYDILPLKHVLPTGPGTLITRSLAQLGTPFEDYWDVYLIRYPDGSHIARHVGAVTRSTAAMACYRPRAGLLAALGLGFALPAPAAVARLPAAGSSTSMRSPTYDGNRGTPSSDSS